MSRTPAAPTNPDRYTRTLSIQAPATKVWEGLTDGALLTRWLCDSLELELRPGGVFRPGGSSCPAVEPAQGEVLAADPGLRLELRWPIDGIDTTVCFDLEQAAGEARLRVTHEARDRWPERLEVPAFWALALSNLRFLLEHPGQNEAPLRMDYTAENTGLVWLGISIQVLPARVYALLTDSSGLSRWLAPNARILAQEGGKLELGWPDRGPSRVIALKKNRLLVHDWNDSRLAAPTKVTWSILPEKAASRLEFLHEGFTPGDDLQRYRQFWSAALVLLKDEAENGRNVGLGWIEAPGRPAHPAPPA